MGFQFQQPLDFSATMFGASIRRSRDTSDFEHVRGADKKSPPPERTPATGSCGYLMTGAADTLNAAMNLAQAVAQFQEKKSESVDAT